VFAELFWTPSIMVQAEDRAHRISQQNCVNIYYLHGPETVDDIIFDILREKSQVVSDALDGKISEYHIQKAQKEQCVEEVKELKQKGTLNPIIIISKKPKEPSISDYFKKAKKSKSKKKSDEPYYEDISDDSGEEGSLKALESEIINALSSDAKSQNEQNLENLDVGEKKPEKKFGL